MKKKTRNPLKRLARRLVGDSSYNATPFRFPAVSGKVAGTYAGNYLGYTVRETAGGAATVVLYDSAAAPTGTTPILEEITLAGNESTRDDYVRPGRLVTAGLYVTIVGQIEGSVFQ